MAAWRRFWNRLAELGGRRERDRELDRELSAHLALLEDEYAKRGLAPDDARRAARLALGGLDQTRELHRRARAFAWIDDLWRDLRHAVRAYAKAPGMAALSVGTLALGIAAATTMFSVVDAVLFRPLGVSDPERLVRLWGLDAESGRPMGFSVPLFRDLETSTVTAQSVAGFTTHLAVHVSVDGQPADRVTASAVTGSFFPTLGLAPAHGRLLGPADDRTPGGHPVLVLSDRYWRSRFAADPAVVGSSIRVNTHVFVVVGVVPAGFHGVVLDGSPDVWIPAAMIVEAAPMFAQFEPFDRRGFTWLDAVVRLKPGVSLEQATAELSTVLAQATTAGGPAVSRAQLEPLATASLGTDAATRRRMSWLLTGVGALVLVVAGAVVAGLQVVRAETRRREVALQYALGASRGRVARQVLAESGALAVMAALCGLAVAHSASGLTSALVPATMAIPASTTTLLVTWRMLVLTTMLVAACTAILGWLVASRIVGGSLAAASERGRASRPGRLPVRHVFVVVQVALAAILLVGAGLLVRTIDRATDVDLGFAPGGVLTATVDVTRSGYDRERGRQFFKTLTEQLGRLPGVIEVAFGRHVPVSPSVSSTSLELSNVITRSGLVLESSFTPVSPGYFRALGMRVEQGRALTDSDEHGPAGLIVNRAFADRFWPGLDPLEQRVLNFGERGTPIIGVVNTTRLFSLREADEPMIYVPEWAMFEGRMTILVRTTGDPLAIAPAVVAAVSTLDPLVPVYQVETLADRVAGSLGRERMMAALLSTFATIALLLSATGLYGVVSHATAVRRREFGVRLALGASRAGILTMVVGEGSRLSAVGLCLGLAVAAVASRTLGSLLFDVEPTDGLTFATIALVLAAVSLVASLVPALRASRVDPAVTLRAD